MMGVYGHGWGMMLGMVLLWAIGLGAGLWLLASLFPAAAFSHPRGQNVDTAAVDPAVQVVRQRYASGEISKSEYIEVLRMLEHAASAADESPRGIQNSEGPHQA